MLFDAPTLPRLRSIILQRKYQACIFSIKTLSFSDGAKKTRFWDQYYERVFLTLKLNTMSMDVECLFFVMITMEVVDGMEQTVF